jgi:DNA-binding transcriptional ArsR family regulator
MRTRVELLPEDLILLSEMAKAMSHPARLAILQILARHDGCICKANAQDLPFALSTVTRHLRALKSAGLLKGEIEEPDAFFCVDAVAVDEARKRFDALFHQIIDAVPLPIDAGGDGFAG